MNIGERIIELRTAKGISTNKLANMAGIAQSALRSIEMNEKSPTMNTLALLLEALDVSFDVFFCPQPRGRDIVDRYNEQVKEKEKREATVALSRSDNPDSDLPDEALKQIEDFRVYIRHKYKKPD